MNTPKRKHSEFTFDSEEESLPLWRHLADLRASLLRSVGVVTLALIGTFKYSDDLVHFLEIPLLQALPEGQRHLYYTGLADKFFAYLKVSLLAALAITFPYLIYEVWRFVAPGLKKSERRFVAPLLLLSAVTLFLGLAFSYYLVIPGSYKFLIQFGSENDRAIITLTEYFDFTLKMLFAMGILFELPVLMIVLGKFGLVRSETFRNYRKFAILANAIVSAVASPSPDPISMIVLMIPIQLLYEVGVLGVRFFESKTKNPPTPAEDELC
jgi:sec-independent protein translocase protein TatC